MGDKLRVLIGAGGSGGHLFPAQQLSQKLIDCDLFFAGHQLGRNPFFQKESVPYAEIESAPTSRFLPFLKATWKGLKQSISLIQRFQPHVVVGFGSYHSFPLLLAAVLLRKKIVLFEANCVLGKVNRLFRPFCRKFALQFPLFEKSRSRDVFVPLLPWKLFDPKMISQEEARKAFSLRPQCTTLLVFGGSQGAQFINQAFCKAALALKEKGHVFQVIHLTGKDDPQSVASAYEEAGIPAVVKAFETEMNLAYIAADCVICRSGAATAAELIQFAKPALLIPFPFATEDHQKKNGQYLAEVVQGAQLLLQEEASQERMVEEIETLLQKIPAYGQALQEVKEEQKGRIALDIWVRAVGSES